MKKDLNENWIGEMYIRLLFVFGLICFFVFPPTVFASWVQTGDTFTQDKYSGGIEFLCWTGGSFSNTFDCANYVDSVGTNCQVIISGSYGIPGASMVDNLQNWDTMNFVVGDQYLDFACTGTNLTQFDVYDPPTPSWLTTGSSTPTGTSSAIHAPYIPFLGAIIFFFAFWSTLFLVLWKRN